MSKLLRFHDDNLMRQAVFLRRLLVVAHDGRLEDSPAAEHDRVPVDHLLGAAHLFADDRPCDRMTRTVIVRSTQYGVHSAACKPQPTVCGVHTAA